MSYKTSLELAYHMGYEDALARKMPDVDKVAVLNEDTCHNTSGNSLYFVCSECGNTPLVIRPHYCPTCGRKVVEVDDG